MTLTLGSIFSGIGGLELGLECAGLGPVRWQVEIDPFCREVLAAHWPEAARHEDVRSVGAANLEPVDVICGGFPCQDVSLAGRGAGLVNGARTGLWREFARIVRELRPRFVVAENVPGLIRRGLDVVVADLTAAGYAVAATRIAAADVGAPHRRDRLFVVAHRDSAGLRDQCGGGAGRVGPVRESLSMKARHWPTPRAKERCQHNSRDNGVALSKMAQTWQTPRATDGDKGGPNATLKGKPALTAQAAKMWPTATATDAEASGAEGYSTESGRHSGTTLTDAAVRQWPTATASLGGNSGGRGFPSPGVATSQWNKGKRRLDDAASIVCSRQGLPTCTHGGKCRPTLNPRFVAWLMGFPLDWLDVATSSKPSVTRSCRRAPRLSGGT